jgi:predicted transposase/invertase (TIGR01784 family)
VLNLALVIVFKFKIFLTTFNSASDSAGSSATLSVMSDIASKHDKFIRLIMTDKSIAVDYFRSCLPAFISERLDFSTLRQLPEVYVSGELQKTMSDIVYSCHTKDEKDEVKVSLLIEHKSYVDKFTPVQIGSYIFSGFLRQLQNEKQISMIIPVLLYHGVDKWEYRTLSGLFSDLDPAWRKYLPDFEYFYHNLGEISDEELRALNNRFLRASLLALKHIFDKEWLGSNVRMLFQWSWGGSLQLRKGFYYYLSGQGIEKRKIKEVMEKEWTIKQFAEYFGKDDIPEDSIAGYFMEQGREQGLERGREQALEQAARNMIRDGYPDVQICSVLGLTADHVARLRTDKVGL